jgi:hypothetical protein
MEGMEPNSTDYLRASFIIAWEMANQSVVGKLSAALPVAAEILGGERTIQSHI